MNITKRSDQEREGKGRMGFRQGACLALALMVLYPWVAGSAPAQEETMVPPQENQAEELINRIREGMKKIDENLLNAKTAGVREKLQENIKNIEDLLKETRERSDQVIRDLDELIRSIKYE